jgi:hypothetical protein
MELCTAVKGWGLTRLLDAGYDYVIYLDPDCLVLKDPAKLIDLLPSEYSVGVVPHTMRAADSDEEIRIVETSSLRHGIYNLGFLLVRNDERGRQLAKWWAARLDRYCFDDFESGLFTDQRWFDLAVGYFDYIKVIRHRGVDVASWNVGQRTLRRDGDGYRIDGDELIFYHFSGVGPAGVHRWVRDKFAPADPLVAELEFKYERMLAEHGQAELANVVPFFDLYSDGGKIPVAHRKLYRSRKDLAPRFSDPYDVTLSSCFRAEAEKVGADQGGRQEAASALVTQALNADEVEARARALFDAEFYRKSRASEETDPGRLWSDYRASAWTSGVHGNRLFDVEYYKRCVGSIDPLEYATPFHHYIADGLRNKVSPNWIYDDDYYLGRYADLQKAVRSGALMCGFQHFSLLGAREGRSGCAFFNEKEYLDLHPDVAAAVAKGEWRSGESHYVMCGRDEGRAFRQRR